MASLPIPFDDLQPEQESAGRPRLQLVPRPLTTCLSVTVRLGDHLAEIVAIQQTEPRRTTYSYAILTLGGERIYQSGEGFLSATGVVEKAAQHLEMLWNSERY